jgi:hypothetical protein
MSSLGLDNRIRDIYFKLARSREQEVEIALASRDSSTFHPSRCRRLTHADGTPFWSFDWQHPAQSLDQQADTAAPLAHPNQPAA